MKGIDPKDGFTLYGKEIRGAAASRLNSGRQIERPQTAVLAIQGLLFAVGDGGFEPPTFCL